MSFWDKQNSKCINKHTIRAFHGSHKGNKQSRVIHNNALGRWSQRTSPLKSRLLRFRNFARFTLNFTLVASTKLCSIFTPQKSSNTSNQGFSPCPQRQWLNIYQPPTDNGVEELGGVFLFGFFILDRERALVGERARGRKIEAPCSAWSPMQGSIPQPWDHDLSQNQESDAQPTDPPRCP